MKKLFKNIANTAKTTAASYKSSIAAFHSRAVSGTPARLHRYRRQGADRRRSGRLVLADLYAVLDAFRHAHRHPADSGDVQLAAGWDALGTGTGFFSAAGLIYAAVDGRKNQNGLRHRLYHHCCGGAESPQPASRFGALCWQWPIAPVPV